MTNPDDAPSSPVGAALNSEYTYATLMSDEDPNKNRCLHDIGNLFQDRFERFGDINDINKAISAHGDAVRLIPESHSDRPGRLNGLGTSLQTRFKRLRNIEDIDEAIAAQDVAVQLTGDDHKDKPVFQNDLGNSLLGRFERLADTADLHKAISAYEMAVRLTPSGHKVKPRRLHNLGLSFQMRFKFLGDVADLDKAILFQDDAVQLASDGFPDKYTFLDNLGNSLSLRFTRLGHIEDIDKAISAQNHALQLVPEGHTSKPRFLNNLGISLQARFRRLRDIADLNKAISSQESAVQLIPEDHPDKTNCLSNLGNTFQARYRYLRDIADLEKAISAQDDAVQLTPDGHPDKPGFLNNLGTSFQLRFEHLLDAEDLAKAISVQRNVLQLTPEGHSSKPTYLFNLGISYRLRYTHLLDDADSNQAIVAQETAVQILPNDHPTKPLYLTSLGKALWERFHWLRDDADAEKAIVHLSNAARSSSGPALQRLKAARLWAECAYMTSSPALLDAYNCAVSLLSHVAWLGLPMAERHKELSSTADIVCKAAAAAVKYKEFGTALEWLEQGRSIVWGQLLQLRTPVDKLHSIHPTLAERLTEVSKQLEQVSTRDVTIGSHSPPSLEEIGHHHHQLALEWDKLVSSARAIPGLEDFLCPKRLSQLRSTAQSGTVVMMNIHWDRCDALILQSKRDDVIHVPLDGLTKARAQKLQYSLEQSLLVAGLGVRSDRHASRAKTQNNDNGLMISKILATLWSDAVEPVLQALAIPISQTLDPPRMWWCLTGPLVFLPFHAAGIYNKSEPGYKITDFVTSSYIPTLSSLLEPPRRQADNFQLLTIAQPFTPGVAPLPSTTEELVRIRKHAGALCIRSLEGIEATKEHVVQGMKDCDWVHLACHGTQNANNPTSSALLLHNGGLKLAEIIRMSLPRADFAFLSACQTAAGDQAVSEEAVHLAAGMLLAGYRGIIATMWSIQDNDAPIIADEVYARLFKDEQPDSTRAAHALHHAVQHLREKGASFLSWVPFIHVGL